MSSASTGSIDLEPIPSSRRQRTVTRRTLAEPRTTRGEPVATRQQIPEGRAGFAEAFNEVIANVQHVIQGKPDVLELILLCLVSEGHLLIEDVPGVGKTSMAKALAASIHGSFGRLQFKIGRAACRERGCQSV